jgi:flavin reductase (DIM6/NTAB) family NADH-FMN oxidoreductase RutF
VIGCSRVAESPVTFECKLVQIVDLLSTDESAPNRVVFGHVVAIHISDEVIVDGIVDIDRLAPISRLGYRDYGRVSGVFSMLRPEWPIER